VNVRQLSDQLNKLVLDGKGEHDVLVNLYGADITRSMQDILDDNNWVISDLNVEDSFIVLDGWQER
jgi:hypothetical protein